MSMVYVQNTGKAGNQIFSDKDDYTRFIFSLAYLNTAVSVGKGGNTRHIIKKGYRGFVPAPKEDQLVGIIAFCLIPSSFHLILEERDDGGVSKFMQKVGTGYSVYLNKKLGTAGRVFEGTYKTSVIQTKEEADKIIKDIHLLPLGQAGELSGSMGIKQEGATGEERERFLEEYPWSSYLDYAGKRKLAFLDLGNLDTQTIDLGQ